MDHDDHAALISAGISGKGIWADLGSGRGAFTLALADCLEAASTIYSIDTDRRALEVQKTRMSVRFPEITLHAQQVDFTRPLDLPLLDGIVMANSLHFIQNKLPVVDQIRTLLKPGGHFVLVEYDTDEPTLYVPYPLSYVTWESLAQEAGFAETKQLATRPSSNMGRIFSALSINPATS